MKLLTLEYVKITVVTLVVLEAAQEVTRQEKVEVHPHIHQHVDPVRDLGPEVVHFPNKK